MPRFLLLFLLFSLAGCIASAPVVPVTPANQQAIDACQSDANVHNDLTWGGVGLGAIATGLGTAAAIETSPDAQKALAITAAIVAGLTTIAGGGASLAASAFANGNCSQYLGALPVLSHKRE